ncbi:hypothetical protein TRFO_01921 [Tritrichomonas foetus]|uniref:MD-2-related lipid-recognition domain-containing protein n=1 Tax=Tritrichomonas foetus TaxID=1144522 RepID=A0A1J4JKC3_9EUKA|nr:hypothetical protein TRFO_01921 [Tritrichomonas foetus]|eukprot:OHS98839.1 hypothetical protein TRFO_01921 [Tritrichomonas foetus]
MLVILVYFISSVKETRIETCQAKNVFNIKKFEISYPEKNRAGIISFQLYAELTSQVENPFLETQIIPEGSRIPAFRIRDNLCRKGILVCPASFSPVSYSNQISLPATLKPGEYTLKLIFREATLKLSCYKIKFTISEDATALNEEKKIDFQDTIDGQNEKEKHGNDDETNDEEGKDHNKKIEENIFGDLEKNPYQNQNNKQK